MSACNPEAIEIATNCGKMRDTPRVKWIRFNEILDVALLKTIVAIKAHIPERGTSQQKFKEVVKVFTANAPPRLSQGDTTDVEHVL